MKGHPGYCMICRDVPTEYKEVGGIVYSDIASVRLLLLGSQGFGGSWENGYSLGT